MKRILALVLALAMALSFTTFAGDTFNPRVDISDDGLTVTVQGSSIFALAPTLTVKCALTQAYVTHNGEVVASTLDTEKGTITFVVADVNGGHYVIAAGDPPNEGGTGEVLPPIPQPEVPVIRPVGPKAYRVNSVAGITSSHRTAKAGTQVVLNITDSTIESVTVTDEEGAAINVTRLKDNIYGFEMPASAVTVTAVYPSPCPALEYTDLDTAAWYHEAVDYVLETGLMDGMGDGLFQPDSATTRAQIVTILWRLEGEPKGSNLPQFPDVAQDVWYTEAVCWAASAQIITGYDNGNFGPEDPISRQQLAAVLWRYAQYKGMDVSLGESTSILSYTDALDVEAYAIPAMQWACGSGLIQGDGGKLLPRDGAARAQSAMVLYRFCSGITQ